MGNQLNKYNVNEIDDYRAKNTYGGCSDMSFLAGIGCFIANVSDYLEKAHAKYGGHSTPTYGTY